MIMNMEWEHLLLIVQSNFTSNFRPLLHMIMNMEWEHLLLIVQSNFTSNFRPLFDYVYDCYCVTYGMSEADGTL